MVEQMLHAMAVFQSSLAPRLNVSRSSLLFNVVMPEPSEALLKLAQ